jgi:cytochrome c2
MYRLSSLSGILLLLTVAASGVEVESNCAMCHQSAPVPDAHPPAATVSAQSCSMCHAVSADDGYFRSVHAKHSSAGLDCRSCHGSAADDALQAKLNTLLAE